MAETVAGWLVIAAVAYVVAGLLFALPFVAVGLGRVDRVAGRGSLGFRLVILPGVVALWPLLARRWLAGAGEPPEEDNPHRRVAAAAADPRADRHRPGAEGL